jgi:hypothetical protein
MSHPPVLTCVLAQLWEGEEDLPSDSTAVLKRIAWKIAQRMYDGATSHCNDLHAELSARCACGDRASVALNTEMLTLTRRSAYPKRGWCLGAINHLEVNCLTATAKYQYVYTCAEMVGGDRRRHTLTVAQRGRDYEIATFVVKGHTFYYFGSTRVTAIFKDCDWSLFVDPQAMQPSTNPHHIIELVSPKSASVTYVRYDRTTRESIVDTTFTNCMTRSWNVRSFARNGGGVAAGLHNREPFGPHTRYTPLHRLVHYNERTMLDEHGDPSGQLESIDSQILKLARPVHETTWRNIVAYPHITALLTKQLRKRTFDAGMKLLLVKAQWREEARAADPVRKCVACAIESVKGRMALGMVEDGGGAAPERPFKRQCVA